MIVKDEEDMLPGALESIAPYVDEIIVVDTGSTDNTVEIAKSFGAKIYIHPWQKNFSLHRNQSLGYAGGEWIVYIDADERLDSGSGPRLKQVIRNALPDTDSFMIHLVNWTRDGQNMGSANLIRMFRNNNVIRFEGIVHNNLVGYDSTEAVDLKIHHYGYDLEQEKKQAKYERTTELLEKMVAEDPNNPIPHHYLAASHLNIKKYDDALEEAQRAIELARKRTIGPQLLFWSYHIASLCNFLKGRLHEAESLCLEALSKNEDHMDSHAVLCSVYTIQGKWDLVIKHGRKFIEILKRFEGKPHHAGLQVLNTQRHEWKVLLQMGISMLEKGMRTKARETFEQVVRAASNKAEGLFGIGEYMNETGRKEEALAYLSRAVAEDPGYTKASGMLARITAPLIDSASSGLLDAACEALSISAHEEITGDLLAARRFLRENDVDSFLDSLGRVFTRTGIDYQGEIGTRQEVARLCSEAACKLWDMKRSVAARQALKLGLDLSPADSYCISTAIRLLEGGLAKDDGIRHVTHPGVDIAGLGKGNNTWL